MLLGIAAVSACCLSGALLHRLLRRRGFPLFSFEHCLSGLLLLTSGFAIVRTGGLTVLLPVPLLVAGGALALPAPGQRLRGEWLAALTGLCCFLLFYAGAFAGDAQYLKYPSGDLVYYARLADHLILGGQENRLLDLATPSAPVMQPYHWGDAWALALLTRACNIRALYALPLVLLPLLAAVFSMGAYRLLRTWSACPMLPALLLAPLLLFTPPAMLLPASWVRSCHLLAAPVAQYPKLLLWGIFACAALARVRNRELLPAGWTLAVAGLFLLPALPIATLGLALITWQLRRDGAPASGVLQAPALLLCVLGWPSLLYLGLSAALPFFSIGASQTSGFRMHPGLLLPVLANLSMLWPYALMLLVVRRLTGPINPGSCRVLVAVALSLAAGIFAWTLTADSMADAPQFLTAMIPVAAIAATLVCMTTLITAGRPAIGALCLAFPLAGLAINYSFGKHTYLTDRILRTDYERIQIVPAISRPWDSLRAVVIKSPSEPDRAATRASVIFYPLELLAFEHPHYRAASLQAAWLADVPAGASNASENSRLKWHTPVMQFARAQGLSAVPPAMQAFWYVKKKQPDVLIIANDAVVPKELLGFLGADSVQLTSKPYRILPLYYGLR